MKIIIQPSKLSGNVIAPPSKSYTHRAIILAALAEGESIIRNPLMSDDTLATIKACQKLGVKIYDGKNKLIIYGINGRFPKENSALDIFCGLSGTTARFITAVAALSPNKIIVHGEKRLRERPMRDLIVALRSLGIIVESRDNFLPIKISGGGFTGGTIVLPGNASSQFLSALLLISPFAEKDTTLIVEDLKSKPYVDITIDLMKTFGVEVMVNKEKYFIKSGQYYKNRNYTVEGDYSSASYFFAVGAITHSKVTIGNLNPDSVQGDKYFLEVLDKMKKNKLPEINLDLGNYPDIVPTVAIIAAATPGTTTISNIGHLRMKETDRITALATELAKMKVSVKEKNDSLIIKGGKLKGAEVNTYNDHRIAMSFAIAGLAADGETIINNAEVVNKSYPDFWKDLQKIGTDIKIIN